MSTHTHTTHTKPRREKNASNPNASVQAGTPADAPAPPHRDPGKEPNPAEGQTERKHDVRKDPKNNAW
ncbi:MAG TPA: hypothetical protein VF407_08115 [Polyangiaceae bacterium]